MYDAGLGGKDSMYPTPGDTRLTYDDFLLFPDDGKRHEIIDGEHYVTASPNTRHQVLAGRLHFEIELFLRQHPGCGRVFLAPLDVVFTRWDVVEPESAVCRSGPVRDRDGQERAGLARAGH